MTKLWKIICEFNTAMNWESRYFKTDDEAITEAEGVDWKVFGYKDVWAVRKDGLIEFEEVNLN